MKGPGRIAILVLAALIMINTAPLQKDHAAGQAAPDFDIEVSTTHIFVNSDNNFIGTFNILVINQCLHSLTVEVTTNCPGATVSPATATVTVAPGATSTVNIAVASSSSTSATLAIAGVQAEIVQVDGAPLSGKSRYANVLVQFQRYSQINMITGQIEVEKGAANARNIKFQNLGNFADHFCLELQDGDPVTGYPLMDVLTAAPSEEVLYPVVFTVPEQTSETSVKIRYRIWSLVNPGTQVNGTITLNIRENAGSNENQIMISPFHGFIMTSGGCLVLLFLALYLHRGRLRTKDSRVHGSFKSRKSIDPVLHAHDTNGSQNPILWSMNVRGSLRHGSHVVSVFVLTILFLGIIITSFPSTSEAQVGTDFTIMINPATRQVDPSPFTPDENAISTCEVTLTSESSMELVVQCSVNGGFAGYVREHRIPPGGQTSFEVACGIQKEMKGEQFMYIQTAEVIEVNGVPFNSGNPVSAGFNVETQAYSFPIIIPQRSAVQMKTDEPMTITVVIVNDGNRYEEIEISSPEKSDLETGGFTFTGFLESVSLDPENNKIFEIGVTSAKDPSHEFTILTIQITSDMEEDRTSSCTIVFASSVTEDDGDDDFIPGAGPAIICMAILLAGITWGHREKNRGGSRKSW